MTLLYDGRGELLSKVFKNLDEKEIKYEQKTLETGDFYFDDLNITIERKTISDFLQGISGHNKTQLFRLNSLKNSYFIIIGDLRELIFNKELSKRYSIYNFLGAYASYSCQFKNVKFLYCLNDNNFVYLMKKIYDKTKELKDNPSEIVFEEDSMIEIKRKKIEDCVKVLSCIPNISVARAESIYKKYYTLGNIKKRLEDGSFEVDGIGNQLQEKILLFLNGVM